MAHTEAAVAPVKSSTIVITWHYAIAKTPPRSQSYQRCAPRSPVETVEDQLGGSLSAVPASGDLPSPSKSS